MNSSDFDSYADWDTRLFARLTGYAYTLTGPPSPFDGALTQMQSVV